MARAQVHFEVFVKASRKHAWRMACAKSTRDEAIKEAQAACAANPAGSARVSRETYDPQTRTFRSMTVFEQGGERFETAPQDAEEDALPCAGPSDLASPLARETIARVLRDWLQRQGVIVLELLHRVDLVERLEAADTELQHAVQKFCVARSSSSAAPVQKIVKKVNALIQSAVEQLYGETRAKVFPKLKPGELGALAARLDDRGDRERLLRAAVVERLRSAKGWRGKLERLLDLADEALNVIERMPWALHVICEFMEELAENEDARAVLCAERPRDRGDEALMLATLFCGEADAQDRLSPVGARLAWHMGEGRFARARAALGRRTLALVKDPRRLKADSLETEVRLARRIAEQLMTASGDVLSLDDITEAFTVRSGRLMRAENLDQMGNAADTPDNALRALIALERDVIGPRNKSALAAFISDRLKLHPVRSAFIAGDAPILQRLAALAELQRRVAAGGFSEDDARALIRAFGALGCEAEDQGQVLSKILRRGMSPVDKATALLRLAANGVLPEGPVLDTAKTHIRSLLSAPQAREVLTSDAPEAQKAARVLSGLMKAMQNPAAA